MEPFAGIVDSVRLATPRVLFNMHAVGPFKKKHRVNDVVVKGSSHDVNVLVHTDSVATCPHNVICFVLVM